MGLSKTWKNAPKTNPEEQNVQNHFILFDDVKTCCLYQF